MKPKTLDTAFAALCQIPGTEKYRYVVAEPTVRTVYHYALNGTSTGSDVESGYQNALYAGLYRGWAGLWGALFSVRQRWFLMYWNA